MHPAISYHLSQAHIADLRHRAQRDTLARAARLGRRNPPRPLTPRGLGPPGAGRADYPHDPWLPATPGLPSSPHPRDCCRPELGLVMRPVAAVGRLIRILAGQATASR
jgi:hypothetical protein